MDDTLQLKCPRCAARMRERARKVVIGFSRQCPQCEGLIFFHEGSPKPEVQDALKQAARLRRDLVRAQETERMSRPTPVGFRHRS